MNTHKLSVKRGVVASSILSMLLTGLAGYGLCIPAQHFASPTAYASAQYPADLNDDNVVNISDLSLLVSKWNTTDAVADANDDGTVNIFDLSYVISRWGGVAGNMTPIADAGDDQNVRVDTKVQLNGWRSVDPDSQWRLTYRWSQVSGPATVTLSSVTDGIPTFIPTVAGTYVLSLTVNDGTIDSAPDTVTINVALAPPGAVTSQDFVTFNTKRILFGHQSVGDNIIDFGFLEMFPAYSVPKPRELAWTSITTASGGFLSDFYVGSNGDPIGKINDFDAKVRAVNGQVDYAFMKFCFVDIVSGTNITQVFNQYKNTMSALSATYPNIKFIYITAALDNFSVDNAVAREQLNQMMRQEYGSTGRLLDLAKIESTRPDGNRVSGVSNGSTYYQLYDVYSYDGGHLNRVGAKIVAEELIKLIAR